MFMDNLDVHDTEKIVGMGCLALWNGMEMQVWMGI